MSGRGPAVGCADGCVAVNPFQNIDGQRILPRSAHHSRQQKAQVLRKNYRHAVGEGDEGQVRFRLISCMHQDSRSSRSLTLTPGPPRPLTVFCLFVTNFSAADLFYAFTAAVCWNKSCRRASLTQHKLVPWPFVGVHRDRPRSKRNAQSRTRPPPTRRPLSFTQSYSRHMRWQHAALVLWRLNVLDHTYYQDFYFSLCVLVLAACRDGLSHSAEVSLKVLQWASL